MYQALIIVHVLLAAGIVGLVLLQQGKGADAGAAFGSGASGTVFGAQGSATFLTRATAVLATLFFATSLGLAVVGDTRKSEEGFMDSPTTQSIPTDLPPVQQDLNTAPVSDMPELPSTNEGSENGGDEIAAEAVAPLAVPDETLSPYAGNNSEAESGETGENDETNEPIPADSQ